MKPDKTEPETSEISFLFPVKLAIYITHNAAGPPTVRAEMLQYVIVVMANVALSL